MHESPTETNAELQDQVHVLELLQNTSVKLESKQAQQP